MDYNGDDNSSAEDLDGNQVDYAKWLGIIANIAIVVGLFFVFFQMKQNERIAKLDLTARSYEMFLQHQLVMMGENPSDAWAASSRPDQMTDAQVFQVHSRLIFMSNYRGYQEWLGSNGMAIEENWEENSEVYLTAEGSYLWGSTPVARRWWSRIGPGQQGSRWGQLAQEGFEKSRGDENGEWIKYLKKGNATSSD